MRPIVLAPLRDEAPACEAFGEIEKVRASEVAVRRHRARVEPFTVTPIDRRVDGSFRVESGRGTEHVVDIVDAGAEHDACTCPDFLSNQLGVCKHVEAVRRAIQRRGALRREARLHDLGSLQASGVDLPAAVAEAALAEATALVQDLMNTESAMLG